MNILTFMNMVIQMRIRLSLISLTVIVLSISCDSDDQITPVAPVERILGKWELTEIGNWPDMQTVPASGYFEFRENSLQGKVKSLGENVVEAGGSWVEGLE